jgi:hypothetical protein
MGDKSPKSKNKQKKQHDKAKGMKAAELAAKQSPSNK